MKNKSHVITRNNIEQEGQQTVRSDVVIPNKLGNGETCQGLLRRFVHKISNNNEISPHNDMVNKTVKTLVPQCLSIPSLMNLFQSPLTIKTAQIANLLFL